MKIDCETYVLTMRMILRLFFFASQTLHISGKVVVLRGPDNSKLVQNLICLSEDDGGALVWNNDIPSMSDRKEFHNIKAFNNNGIDCKMNKNAACLQHWHQLDWNFTNSVETSMGPVFDQRWEEFEEYSNFGSSFDQVNLKRQIPSAGALSFSTRAPNDVHILLCDTKEFEKSACFWIIISGWDNTKSAIRKCMNGVPNTSPKKAPADKKCAYLQDEHKSPLLSETEWRTFIITWDFTEGNQKIFVYDTNNEIVSYSRSISSDYKNFERLDFNFIFIKTKSYMLFRVHEYDFLYTSTENASLMSSDYQFNDPTICIQALIGLCTECDADVEMIDFSNNKVIEIVTVKGSSKTEIHNLPMWHLVKLNKTFPTSNSNANYSVIIRVIPRLRAPSSNPLWAIADVRQCFEKESLRRGSNFNTGKVTFSWGRKHSFWPTVTCQKLFYNEHTVVSATLQATQNIVLDDQICPKGKIGPGCLFSCANDLRSNFDCSGAAICYKNGCTCSAGYWDYDCFQHCPYNWYGHNCKNACGSCKTFPCNYITGACINEECASDLEKIYVPPLCHIGIDKLEAPTVVSAKTSIQAELRMVWRKEYEQIPIQYSFVLKEEKNKENIDIVSLPLKNVLPNTTLMTGYFDKNVEPGASYWVVCTLFVMGYRIDSKWTYTVTDCDLASSESFVMTSTKNTITINKQTDPYQLYPCPPKWYSIELQDTNKKQVFPVISVVSFPHEISGLAPYTSYDVIIGVNNYRYNNSSELFSEIVSTLEDVPTEVLNVNYLLNSNTQVTLMWEPPNQPNGKLREYEVTLRVEVYHGCEDLKLPMPNHPAIIIKRFPKETNVTVSDLHPYATYVAQVIARNSEYSSNSTSINFITDKTEIPTEVFTQLKVSGWLLSWQAPKDCSTILGPLMARIMISGVSGYVKHYSKSIDTNSTHCDLSTINPPLNGAEQYRATVYVIRQYNGSVGNSSAQKRYFETPPTAPPVVTNLEVDEIDDRERSKNMFQLHLKWQSPLPPLNGQLHYYNVTLCYDNNDCSSEKVELSNSCDLWDDYICEKLPISKINNLDVQVFAYNKHVDIPSPPARVSQKMLKNTKPDRPEEFTRKINDNSVVNLQWRHPQKTGRHLRCFRITIEEKTSNLKRKRSLRSTDTRKKQKYSVETEQIEQYKRYYTKNLYLLPSTKYNVSIQAVTTTNETSSFKSLEVSTPSDASFDGDLQVIEQKSNSMISLRIPPVVNDTLESITHIIVKGPNRCTEYSKVPRNLEELANLKMYEVAWYAAIIPTDEIARRNYIFIIGDNQSYENVKNCPLHPKNLYEVAVIVEEKSSGFDDSSKLLMLTKLISIGEVPSDYKAWLISLLVILTISIVAAGYYFFIYRRRNQRTKKQIFHDEMILSENIENYELDTKFKEIVSKSMQDLTTPFDKQSLSRAITPEEPLIVVDINQEKTLSVKVKEFEDYVREAVQSGLLDRQYETFPRGQTRPWDYGKLPQNKSKNRYGNLIAYDETRVILNKLPDDAYSDYINANYITGYKKQKHYIATQGPKPNTVIDFWRMIWQENVLIICMVANLIENGKTKCEQYWPDIGKKKKYGDVVVLNARHNVFADYCFRTFHVTRGEETRKIEHLHYTAWPDHGVPLYTHSVVTYLKKLLATPPGNGPVVVHCSAGIGRTGTIILCDICLHRAAAEGVVDVFADTASIRNERANMVDNKQQYLLAHLAVMECLLSIPTTLPCNETLPARIKEFKIQLPVLQKELQNIAWQDEALRPVTSPPLLSECNRAKNRFPELISDKISRIYLKRYPASDEDSDYLSAVYIDGVKLQNQYLATQLPMPSTLIDFWRMVAEFKVELILMLQPPDPLDPTCCVIAPTAGEFKPTPYLNIKTKHIVEMECYTSQQLLLIDNSEKPSREQSVTILCLTEWKPGRNQPPPPVMTMVSFWQAAERIARGDGPTVALCHDGVTGCGLYLALSFLLERMTVERECDVGLAVRAVRRSRPDFVRSLEHLEYLCDAVTTYLEYFETYANFS